MVEPATATPEPTAKPSGASGSETVRCSRCGAEGETGRTNCPECGAFLPSNEANLRHGLRRYRDNGELPGDLRVHVETFRDELISDQGGEAELTAVRRAMVDKLVDLEVATRLLMAEVVRRGIDSRPGKSAWSSALRTIEAWHRIAGTLGMDRRQRRVPSLDDVLGEQRNGGGSDA